MRRSQNRLHAIVRLLLLALAMGAAPETLRAAEGRKEISQAAILAAGGFPHVITRPGSYVLTTELTIPDNTFGIRIDADDVHIDLNGFAIRGRFTCTSANCPAVGTSAGISVPTAPITNGRRCSVRNGAILGIRGNGIMLRDDAYVDGMSISSVALNAVVTGPHGLVTRNRLTNIGRAGLFLGDRTAYADNVLGPTGLGGLVNVSVIGGTPIGRNACDDQRCNGGDASKTFLLFPFVTNQLGFETGIAVSNTTSDPDSLGSSPQSGTCTFRFFGANAPPATTTGSIASGTTFTAAASSLAPNFQGYMIAECHFSLAHGFAFLSDAGARNFAMGYLALVIQPGRQQRLPEGLGR